MLRRQLVTLRHNGTTWSIGKFEKRQMRPSRSFGAASLIGAISLGPSRRWTAELIRHSAARVDPDVEVAGGSGATMNVERIRADNRDVFEHGLAAITKARGLTAATCSVPRNLLTTRAPPGTTALLRFVNDDDRLFERGFRGIVVSVTDHVTLGPGDVHLHYRLLEGDRGLAGGWMDAAQQTLSAQEHVRARRLMFPSDRVAFVAAHALLRQTLSRYECVAPDQWVFTQNAYGKPGLAAAHGGMSLQFNLTHTRGLVACVVSRNGDVGVDVESARSRVSPLELATRFFSAQEAASLLACPEDARHARFAELWTLKEAYIKALGLGLSHPLDTFGFVRADSAPFRFEPPSGEDPTAWQFGLYAPTPDYRMAVAIQRPPDAGQIPRTVRVWQATGDRLLLALPPCLLARFNP